MNSDKKKLLLKPDFCFYHIPKCGGSTVRRTLYKYFYTKYNKDEIYCPEMSKEKYNFVEQNEFNKFLENNSESQIEKIKILLCHTMYKKMGISDHFKPHISAVVFRDPTDRIISHYEFFDYPVKKIHISELSDSQLEQYVNSNSSIFCNYLSHENKLETAIEVLRNEISVVGTTDRLHKFICNILELFDINSDSIKLENENINTKKSSNETLRNKVAELLHDSNDYWLYEIARKNTI